MKVVWQRHARLPEHRYIKSHRIDDPDAPRPYFALDCRNICRGVSGTSDEFMGVVESVDGQDDDFGAFRDGAIHARQLRRRGFSVDSSIRYMNLRAPHTQHAL